MSRYQEQKKTKPPIEALAEALLLEALKADLLDFVSFLRENRMSPQWGSTHSYNLSCKNRRVCIIKIAENQYQLWLNTQYNEDFNECLGGEDEKAKQYLRNHITYCFGCGTCKPGWDGDILGTEIKGACFNPVIRMVNPEKWQLDLARKLVLLRKKAICEGKAPRVTYIAASKR